MTGPVCSISHFGLKPAVLCKPQKCRHSHSGPTMTVGAVRAAITAMGKLGVFGKTWDLPEIPNQNAPNHSESAWELRPIWKNMHLDGVNFGPSITFFGKIWNFFRSGISYYILYLVKFAPQYFPQIVSFRCNLMCILALKNAT